MAPILTVDKAAADAEAPPEDSVDDLLRSLLQPARTCVAEATPEASVGEQLSDLALPRMPCVAEAPAEDSVDDLLSGLGLRGEEEEEEGRGVEKPGEEAERGEEERSFEKPYRAGQPFLGEQQVAEEEQDEEERRVVLTGAAEKPIEGEQQAEEEEADLLLLDDLNDLLGGISHGGEPDPDLFRSYPPRSWQGPLGLNPEDLFASGGDQPPVLVPLAALPARDLMDLDPIGSEAPATLMAAVTQSQQASDDLEEDLLGVFGSTSRPSPTSAASSPSGTISPRPPSSYGAYVVPNQTASPTQASDNFDRPMETLRGSGSAAATTSSSLLSHPPLPPPAHRDGRDAGGASPAIVVSGHVTALQRAEAAEAALMGEGVALPPEPLAELERLLASSRDDWHPSGRPDAGGAMVRRVE